MDFFKIAKFFIFASVLSVIFVGTKTLFPFIVTKYTFFRLTVELSSVCFLLGYIFKTSYFNAVYKERIKYIIKSPIFIAVTAFAFFFTLSSFFAYDPIVAFWSNFERGEGGFQILHFFVFLFLLAVLLKEEKDWKNIFKLSIFSGGIMLLYGILAGMGVKGFVGPVFSDGVRFQGSLGNAAYVGVYLIFATFYLAYLYLHRRSSGMFLGMLAAISVIFIWLTQTRGPVYGLVGGAIAFFIYVLAKSAWRWKKEAFATFIICIAIGGSFVYFHDSAFVKALPGSRLFNIGFTSSSWESRLWTWGSAIEGIKERPILGWGPENFGVVFDKYFNPRHYIPGEGSETWYDRAHNVYLDYLVETGIFGFISFISIFVAYYVQFARKRKEIEKLGIDQKKSNQKRETHNLEYGLFFALPVAYLMQGVVLFDILPTYINLFLFLAFAIWKFQLFPKIKNTPNTQS